MRTVYTYFDGVNSPVEIFFEEALPKIKDKFLFQMPFITNEKMPFYEPHIKHFSIAKYKRLYEMRIKSAGCMVRIIFYEHENEIVLLYAFYKKGNKDTEKAMDYALKILNTICDENGRVKKSYKKEMVL